MQAKFPDCFSPDFKPLAIHIHKQLTSNTDYSKTVIRKFLNGYCRNKDYVRAVNEGRQRFNLDGSVSSPVSKDNKQYAEKGLNIIRKYKHKEKKDTRIEVLTGNLIQPPATVKKLQNKKIPNNNNNVIKEQPEEKQEDATNTEVKKYRSNITNGRI